MKRGKWRPTFLFINQWKNNETMKMIDLFSVGYTSHYSTPRLIPLYSKEISIGILGFKIYLGMKLKFPRTCICHPYIPKEYFKPLK